MVTVAHGPLSNMFRDPAFDAVSRRHDQGPVALPSIRQAIPELHLTKPSHRYSGSSNLPSPTEHGAASPSTHHHRRISPEDERERNGVARPYRSPEHRHPSPPSSHRVPSLPSLADMSASAGMAQQQQHQHQRRDSRYYEESRREDPRHHHHHRASYDYGYTHAPSPTSVGHPYDRPSSSSYSHYQDNSGRYAGGELGVMSMGSDAKMRKRRGNLPKETTDKLRSWFVAHLQHPYPTEDEKQDLMRQTGLQMNQISNWFINARRRQLPAMINSARAETDSVRSGSTGRDRMSDDGFDEDMGQAKRDSM